MPRIALTQQRGVWISPGLTQGSSWLCFTRFDAVNVRSEAHVPLFLYFRFDFMVEVSREGRQSWKLLVGKEQEKREYAKGTGIILPKLLRRVISIKYFCE